MCKSVIALRWGLGEGTAPILQKNLAVVNPPCPTKIHRLTCGEGVWGPCSPYSECDGRVKSVTSCGIEPLEPGLMGPDGVLAPFETALGPRWTWHARATVLSRLRQTG